MHFFALFCIKGVDIGKKILYTSCIMYDISISSTKVRGRPRGRPNPRLGRYKSYSNFNRDPKDRYHKTLKYKIFLKWKWCYVWRRLIRYNR